MSKANNSNYSKPIKVLLKLSKDITQSLNLMGSMQATNTIDGDDRILLKVI